MKRVRKFTLTPSDSWVVEKWGGVRLKEKMSTISFVHSTNKEHEHLICARPCFQKQ
jgi:hypothetical protein